MDLPLGLIFYFPDGVLGGHRIAAEWNIPVISEPKRSSAGDRLGADDRLAEIVRAAWDTTKYNMKGSLAIIQSSTHLAAGSRLTACAAFWCGVHCAATPFLVVAAPALALSEGVERGVWVGTILLGAVMVVMGPARKSAAVVPTFLGGGRALDSLARRLAPAAA